MVTATQSHKSPAAHGPVESFRLNNVSLSIFENESNHEGKTQKFYRAKVDRRYFDNKTNQWNSSNSFNVDELLRLQHLIARAVEFMSAKPTGESDREQ